MQAVRKRSPFIILALFLCVSCAKKSEEAGPQSAESYLGDSRLVVENFRSSDGNLPEELGGKIPSTPDSTNTPNPLLLVEYSKILDLLSGIIAGWLPPSNSAPGGAISFPPPGMGPGVGPGMGPGVGPGMGPGMGLPPPPATSPGTGIACGPGGIGRCALGFVCMDYNGPGSAGQCFRKVAGPGERCGCEALGPCRPCDRGLKCTMASDNHMYCSVSGYPPCASQLGVDPSQCHW